jgi:predicted glycosyltransferase involved in capsule biosynthesis
VIVLEIADRCSGILKSLLPKRVSYIFAEDKDNVLYRTKHLNEIIPAIKTPIIALWDADIVVDKKAIIEAIGKVRTKDADVAYPYNGICLNIPEIIRSYYLRTKDVRILYRNKNKLATLYDHPLVGGGVVINREKYIQAGMENEAHYGWGNDDFDRYHRFRGLNYTIHRVNTPLFHLYHPRGDNSKFRSDIFKQLSGNELKVIECSSKEEIEVHILNS